MTHKEYLDYCVDTYYSKIISKYNFRLIDKSFNGIGADYEYQNDNFQLRFINDHGIVDGEIASLFDSKNYKGLYSLCSLISLSQIKLEDVSNWDLKMILSKTLSCEEESFFIDSNYDLITRLLDKDHYMSTFDKIEDLQKKRPDFLFNKT